MHDRSKSPQNLSKFRSNGDLNPNLQQLPHPSPTLLHNLYTTVASVQITTSRWTTKQNGAAINRSPHRSALEHNDILYQEQSTNNQAFDYKETIGISFTDVITGRSTPIRPYFGDGGQLSNHRSTTHDTSFS
jgi:hypothetical protein